MYGWNSGVRGNNGGGMNPGGGPCTHQQQAAVAFMWLCRPEKRRFS